MAYPGDFRGVDPIDTVPLREVIADAQRELDNLYNLQLRTAQLTRLAFVASVTGGTALISIATAAVSVLINQGVKFSFTNQPELIALLAGAIGIAAALVGGIWFQKEAATVRTKMITEQIISLKQGVAEAATVAARLQNARTPE